MTAPEKPGLSNEEFIENARKFYVSKSLPVLAQALDRLESATRVQALIVCRCHEGSSLGPNEHFINCPLSATKATVERDFDFKDVLDSALYRLLDDCRRNCQQGCHTIDDDTAWDECPEHKFMTDEIEKLRKTHWPEVHESFLKMVDELALADKALDRLEASISTKVPEAEKCKWCHFGKDYRIHDSKNGTHYQHEFESEPSVATKERDYTPEEAYQELKRRFPQKDHVAQVDLHVLEYEDYGKMVNGQPTHGHGIRWHVNVWVPEFNDSRIIFEGYGDSFRSAFASADKAKADGKEEK